MTLIYAPADGRVVEVAADRVRVSLRSLGRVTEIHNIYPAVEVGQGFKAGDPLGFVRDNLEIGFVKP
jgi:murein DD-endopeptidase MepM/ murein hydrolase activator NlpD